MFREFLHRRSARSRIWSGIYRSFADVPRSGPEFSGEVWRDTLLQGLAEVTRGDWNEDVVVEHEAIVLLVRYFRSTVPPVRILDFGGGFGASHVYLTTVVPEVPLQYVVIEVPGIVAAARALVPEHERRFDCEIKRDHDRPDIVFVKSALQYVADYRAALSSLLKLDSRFVLLEKFSGVDCPSFVSGQLNVQGSVIPYWFISVQEVIELARSLGYSLVLRRLVGRHYDQSEFPSGLRMDRASTLLFCRDSAI